MKLRIALLFALVMLATVPASAATSGAVSRTRYMQIGMTETLVNGWRAIGVQVIETVGADLSPATANTVQVSGYSYTCNPGCSYAGFPGQPLIGAAEMDPLMNSLRIAAALSNGTDTLIVDMRGAQPSTTMMPLPSALIAPNAWADPGSLSAHADDSRQVTLMRYGTAVSGTANGLPFGPSAAGGWFAHTVVSAQASTTLP